jgi:hypothetical protein
MLLIVDNKVVLVVSSYENQKQFTNSTIVKNVVKNSMSIGLLFLRKIT